MAIPIPLRPSGILLGAPDAQITIDAFLDIQCPYFRNIWFTLIDVLDYYKNESISLKTHIIALSNHRQAWDLSLGLFALADGDASQFYNFATYLYDRQEQFYNAEFMNKTHEDLRQSIADMAHEHSGLDRKKFIQRMSDSDIYTLARSPIRYASTKSVWATPTLFINNADDVELGHQSSLSDWQKIIDPLIEAL